MAVMIPSLRRLGPRRTRSARWRSRNWSRAVAGPGPCCWTSISPSAWSLPPTIRSRCLPSWSRLTRLRAGGSSG